MPAKGAPRIPTAQKYSKASRCTRPAAVAVCVACFVLYGAFIVAAVVVLLRPDR